MPKKEFELYFLFLQKGKKKKLIDFFSVFYDSLIILFFLIIYFQINKDNEKFLYIV